MDASHTVEEIIGSNEIRLDDESTSLSSSPALCIQDADVCKPCTRFSVSPRINRIRRIVGTYNEFSPPVKLLHYVAASKREFPASLLRRFRPFQRGTRTICTRCNTRSAHIFVARVYSREMFALFILVSARRFSDFWSA